MLKKNKIVKILCITLVVVCAFFAVACNKGDSSSQSTGGRNTPSSLKQKYVKSIEEYNRCVKKYRELEERAMSGKASKSEIKKYDNFQNAYLKPAEEARWNAFNELWDYQLNLFRSKKIDENSDYTYGNLIDDLNGYLQYVYNFAGQENNYFTADVEYFTMKFSLHETARAAISYDEQQKIAAKVWEYVLSQEDLDSGWWRWGAPGLSEEDLKTYNFMDLEPGATISFYFVPRGDGTVISYTDYPNNCEDDELSRIILSFVDNTSYYKSSVFRAYYPSDTQSNIVDEVLSLIASELKKAKK